LTFVVFGLLGSLLLINLVLPIASRLRHRDLEQAQAKIPRANASNDAELIFQFSSCVLSEDNPATLRLVCGCCLGLKQTSLEDMESTANESRAAVPTMKSGRPESIRFRTSTRKLREAFEAKLGPRTSGRLCRSTQNSGAQSIWITKWPAANWDCEISG
jgi:hypothetical protein